MIIQQPSILGYDAHKSKCFGCDPTHSHGLNGDFTFNEVKGEVSFIYQTKQEQQGMPGYLHGGIISSLLDEAQGAVCLHLGYPVMTKQLKVKYLKGVPILSNIIIETKIIKMTSKRCYTEGFLLSEDRTIIHATSKAVWYVFKPEVFVRLLGIESEHNNHLLNIIKINKEKRAHFMEQYTK